MTPIYNTKLFTQVWDNEDLFMTEFNNCPFKDSIKSESVQKLYYLLYAKYGNSPIANNDVNQFKIKLFSIIFKFGPSWEKRLEIQDKLRSLSDEELVTGNKMIQNHSYNPGTAPSTSSLEELDTVNEQHASTNKRAKIDAYAMLWGLLATDVTSEFIDRFNVCFKIVVRPENPLLYESED